jgi:integrase
MKGSVTKYSIKGSSRPRWRFRVYAGKNETGTKVFQGKGGFAKEGDARTEMQRFIEALQNQNTPAPSQQRTLGEWLKEWLSTYAAERVQPKTLEGYTQLVRNYVSPIALAGVPLSELTHHQIEAALYGLLKAQAKRKEHVSASTVRHVGHLLGIALNKAFRLELIQANPMARVEMPSVEKKDMRSLTPIEIRALRETCRGDWTFALVELALATAARRGELLALTWGDLESGSGTLMISKSLEQTAAGLRIKRPKNGKSRSCQLPHSALVALEFLREQQAQHRRLFAGDYQPHGLIFCRADGGYYKPDLVSHTIITRMRRAGIKGASFHTLRHTHASNLISRGVPLPAVSARLGHSNPAMTVRIYSHALPADDQRAADTWDGIIDGPVQ